MKEKKKEREKEKGELIDFDRILRNRCIIKLD